MRLMPAVKRAFSAGRKIAGALDGLAPKLAGRSPSFALRAEPLRQALIEGERSGCGGPLDPQAILREARHDVGLGA